MYISGGTGTRNPGFGYSEYHGEMDLRQVFLHLLPNFCHIWWFFKVEHTKGAAELWKIHKYSKNLAIKWRKALFNFFGLIPVTRNPDFGYPFRVLGTRSVANNIINVVPNTVHSVSCTRIVPYRIGPALGEP